jgi:hypothetical protein
VANNAARWAFSSEEVGEGVAIEGGL